MLEARFRPVDKWPGERTIARDRRAPFKAGYRDTLDLLERELRYLAATSIIIEAFFNLNQIRNDGWPYSNATPTSPGVIVGFNSKHGPLRLHCDTCRDWEQNLRAIAMHLNHLRMSGIYGVGKDGQQYRGWTALPGAIITPPAMSIDEAAFFVAAAAAPLCDQITDYSLRVRAKVAGAAAILCDAQVFQVLYRLAAKALHPDTNGGQQSPDWNKLQTAAEMLKKRHGLS